jgi:hypothetical protein
MHTKKFGLRFLLPFLLTSLAFVYAFATPTAGAQQAAGTFNGGTPRFLALNHGVHMSGATALAARSQAGLVDTIPYWSDLFTYGGNPYPFQMVGTSPADKGHKTTVPTELVALNLVFSDGNALNGADRVKDTVDSPIFEKADFTSGHTQYGDAMQRAEFWQLVKNKNYHVLLGQPNVLHTVTLDVPAADGQTTHSSRTGALIGLIDIDWFDAQIQTEMLLLHISPKTFPIFLSNDVFLYEGGDPSNCCVIGYHSAVFSTSGTGRSQIQTYAWSSYTTPGIFSVPIDDIHALSHEVAEWYNDPFVDNVTPNWQSPIAPQYGCNNFLEVGDPLVGVAFLVKTDGKVYHPQDIAFYSWFTRQTPSLGIHHQYTYLGTFNTYAPSC